MTSPQITNYIIEGGQRGRARLAVIARVLAPTTRLLLDRFEPLEGRVVIDAACGGGDVTFELARRVGPSGRVIGLDLDEVKVAMAREEAERLGMRNIEFQSANVLDPWPVNEASLVYARFVLTHLASPEYMLARARAALAPGGRIVVEDIDYAGEFCDPPFPAFERASELFIAAARQRGANPFIGPTLARLLESAGFSAVDASLVQPFGRSGDAKQVPLLTFAGIGETLARSELASREEIARITAEFEAFTARPDTTLGWPRIFQVWGHKEATEERA